MKGFPHNLTLLGGSVKVCAAQDESGLLYVSSVIVVEQTAEKLG